MLNAAFELPTSVTPDSAAGYTLGVSTLLDDEREGFWQVVVGPDRKHPSHPRAVLGEHSEKSISCKTQTVSFFQLIPYNLKNSQELRGGGFPAPPPGTEETTPEFLHAHVKLTGAQGVSPNEHPRSPPLNRFMCIIFYLEPKPVNFSSVLY